MTNKHEKILIVLSEIHTEFLQIQPHLLNKQQFMPFAISDLLERLETVNMEINDTSPNNTFFNTYVLKLKTLLGNALASHEQ